jgi:hypothetical protein
LTLIAKIVLGMEWAYVLSHTGGKHYGLCSDWNDVLEDNYLNTGI